MFSRIFGENGAEFWRTYTEKILLKVFLLLQQCFLSFQQQIL